ncbi:hypothetical protein GCM10027343_16140 [Noviherbaspirillum agri]
MKKLFIFSTALFWLAVLGIWAGSGQVADTTAQAPKPAAEKRISLAEVARHASPDDCWMAINGAVYDITPYLPEHPSNPKIIQPWCGEEASEAYRTKTKGRSHSPEADALLARFRIGLAEGE